MTLKSILLTLAVSVGALTVQVDMAAAATCSVGSGNGNNATSYTLSEAVGAECFSGNDTNTIVDAFTMFGKTGWVLSEKNDGPDGDGVITFTDAPSNGDKSGDWAIDALAGLDHIVITLKAGSGFGAFLLDLTTANPLTGTWETGKGLSHASIYYNGVPDTSINPVPLPAAAWMLLAGLGGLVAIARRRAAA